MHISDCLAYSEITVTFGTIDDHVNINIKDERNGNSFSLTLSGPQTATMATGLIEVLMKLGEKPDRLQIFGKAKLIRKAA